MELNESTVNAIRQLERRRVHGSDAEYRKRVLNPDYWRRLNPECRISDQPFPHRPKPYGPPAEGMERHLERLREEGYFQTSPIVDGEELAKLSRCIRAVVAQAHDAAYALLYDDFYWVMARLQHVLEPVLGLDYQLVPDEYAAYFVPASHRAAGAHPHRDTLRTPKSVESDGTPLLVNVWIPLTDVAADNSCLYVLPAHLDPHYPHRSATDPGANSPTKVQIAPRELQGIRALPAPAGAVLCLSPHVIHWGGRSSDFATHPRMSFSTYFQSRRVPPFHEVTMDIPSPLTFERRLHLIERVWHRTGGGPPGV